MRRTIIYPNRYTFTQPTDPHVHWSSCYFIVVVVFFFLIPLIILGPFEVLSVYSFPYEKAFLSAHHFRNMSPKVINRLTILMKSWVVYACVNSVNIVNATNTCRCRTSNRICGKQFIFESKFFVKFIFGNDDTVQGTYS